MSVGRWDRVRQADAARRRAKRGERRPMRWVASILAAAIVVTVLPARSDAWIPPDPSEWKLVDYELVKFRNDYLYDAPDSSGVIREHRGCEKVWFAVIDGADGLEGRGQYLPPADWRVRVGRKSVDTGGLSILGASTVYTRVDGTQVVWGTAPSGKPKVGYALAGRSYKGENSGNVKARCDALEVERPDSQFQATVDDIELWDSVDNQNPVAAFQYEIDDANPRQVRFTNRSADPDVTSDLSYQWYFGDGATSREKDPVHTYAADGDYEVRLLVFDGDGGSDDEFRTVEIGGPVLEGALFAFPTGDLTIKEGDRQGVRLRVENDGDQPLTDVAITETTLTPIDPDEAGLVTLAPTPGGRVLSGALGTGSDNLDFADFDLVAKEAGKVQIAMTVEADRPDGTPVQAVIEQEVTIDPAPIKVELEVRYAEPPGGATNPPGFQKDNNGDGEVDAKDHRIEIDVTATNASEEPVSAVEVRDAAEPIDFDDKYLGGGEVYMDPLDLPANTEFGDLEPGASETLTFAYEAKEPVWADATTIIQGRIGDTDPGELVTGVGRTIVKLDTDLALEAYMDLEERPYQSGQVVRLAGKIKNVMEDKPLDDGTVEKAKSIAVILDPIVEENAGNGYVFPGDYGGRTPQGNQPFVLAPGQEQEVRAILQTARSEDPTNAHVRYLVRAWEIDDQDPEAPALEIDQSRIVIDDDDGRGTEFTTPLAPVSLKPDKLEECETEILDAIITCNLWAGLREMATGLVQLVPVILTGTKEYVRAGFAIRAWMYQQWTDYVRAVLGDPQAMQRLITEIEVQMETFVQAKLMSQEALDAVGNSVVEFFQEAETALAEGDTNQIVAWTARFVGENPDLGFAAIAKVRAARALFGTTLPSASQSEATVALAKAAEDASDAEKLALQSKVDEAIARGEDPTKNGTFKGDEDVTNMPSVFRTLYGARKTELNHMLDLAKKENILIAFRARAGRAADLIRDGLARQKPMDVKTKGVNEIDINYLGYRREAKDLVELVEPPIDWRLVGNDVAFDVELDLYMDFLKTKHPELADPVWAAEVRSRLKTRTKQWVKEVPNFKRYEEQGIDVGFGYGEQGLDGSLDDQFEQLRKARVNEGFVKDPYTGEMRRYYNVEMADASGNNFLPITGDIDIVAILNADRTPLTEVNKRVRVYRELAKLVGMQHGDSFSWINNDGMIEFLREHIAGKPGSEALVVAGSDGRARMGYFEERLSTVTDADGKVTSKTTFHMLTGGPRELITDPAGGVAVNRANSYFDTLSGYTLDPKFYLPGALENFMNGVETTGLGPPPFDPFSGAVQPDGEGGALVYQEGGIEGDALDPSTLGLAGADRTAGDDSSLDLLVAEIAAAGFGPDARPDQGAQGGRWVPFDAAAAAAASPSGRFPRGVITALAEPTAAGAKVLPVTPLGQLGVSSGSPWFQVGDEIVVDPGGANEERHVVAKLSPFTLTAPIANDHLAATAVVLIPRQAEEPTEPTVPTTPTVPTVPTTPTTPTVPTTPTNPTTPTVPGGPGSSGSESAAVGSGSLPRTGSTVTDVLPLALALVLGGAGLLAIRARTRRRPAA